ncbi:MAG: hypothetical protein KDD02_24995, partial [Phaeodactylibacter sp.]|nr:hypothetical protein [Phaeodactylibacter sp.]
ALGLTEADKTILQRGFALSRLTGGLSALVGGLMPEITDLSQLATYDTGHLLEKIIASGGETPNGETPEEYAANLVSLAQRNFPSAFFLERKTARDIQLANLDDTAKNRLYATYRHLGPADELGKPNVLNNRRKLLHQFVADNPGFDLPTADFFKKDENGEWALRYSGLPPERREHVRQQFLSFQRTMRLAGSYEAQDALLAAGIDSSAELMRRSPAELQAQLGEALDVSTINSILQHGQQQLQQLANTAVALQGLGVASTIGFAVDNYPADLKNELENIYGYSDLFGSQDYCACEHCKSIFGPAAYFVDLMKFVEDHVALVPLPTPNPEAHPIALHTRRPDLWNLELTCENTNAAIPYLQIINEIKQHYIAEVMGAILGGKAAKDVDIWAEFARLPPEGSTTDLVGLALNIGNTWKNSFRLAYNRPFEESQALLEHFGMRYADILQALRVTDLYRMDQAYLGLSAEEWRVITTPDTNLGDLRNLRFGFPADSLHDLEDEPSYFKLTKCPVTVFLRATGLSRADMEFLLSDKSYLHRVNSAIKWVRVAVTDEVQAYQEWIEGLDNAAVLDHIHRILRLQRHLPWTLRELDLAVQALGGLSADHIAEIARMREMQRVLGLTVEETVALQHGIPDTPLYTRTVYNELLNSSVEMPVPGMLSRLFDPARLPLNGSGLLRDPEKMPFLLQALGAAEEDFDALYRMFFGTADVNLDWGSVSLFYRLLRLAKALGITGEEMIYLLQLSHPNPGDSVAGWILDLARAMEVVRKMPLSIQEIWFIVRGEKASKIDFKYTGDPERKETTKGKVLEWIGAFVQDKRLTGADAMAPAGVFQEHLAQSLTATRDIFAGMQAWYAGYAKVWDEAQDNFGRDNQNFQFDELIKMLPVFERVKLLIDKLELDAADLLFLNSTQGSGGDLLTKLENIFDLQQLATYARLKKQGSGALDIDAFRSLWSADQNDSQSEAIAALLNCESNQVKTAFKLDAVSSPRPVSDVLVQIEGLLGVFGRLGIYEKNTLEAFAHNDYSHALQYETALHAAFRASYTTDEAYEKAWEPIENRINEQRRDVLCAFLLALDQQNNFHDTGDLYAYFLVDVEMSGCARVSRILAATLSLQLYIHRVLMGLEVSTDDGTGKVRAIMDERAKVQWEWRKNYRVWEANRKVFLYPENWIEPELRDNKSPLFKTLEDELLQQKISLESAEQAYVQYLKGFAEVGQLVIAGAYYEPEKETYYIFGRTATDPYQYYYRKMRVLPMDSTTKVRAKQWTAWEKVELAIDAPYVSPIMHNGRLYLFWVGVVTMEKNKFEGGDSKFSHYEHAISLAYSNLTENGKWLQPQKVKNFCAIAPGVPPGSGRGEIDEVDLRAFENSKTRLRVYPYHDLQNELKADYFKYNGLRFSYHNHTLNFWQNYAEGNQYLAEFSIQVPKILWVINHRDNDKLFSLGSLINEKNSAGAASIEGQQQLAGSYLVSDLSAKDLDRDLRLVFNKDGDFIFRNKMHQFLIRNTDAGEIVKGLNQNNQVEYLDSNRESIWLTTTVAEDLAKQLTKEGLTSFLSPITQNISEHAHLLDYKLPSQLSPPFVEPENLDFSGAHGLYFRELFFHIPFLIAGHLKAEGKYQEADYWYRKIFDPSAAYYPSAAAGDRYWQFLEFRGHTLPKLLEILKDPAAIEAYESDPFNPHAIARLRIGPYQKSIVMKYVDNLLDWGDSLFRRDTWESNTEAMMLYQLAHDILGPRPQNTGPCESAVDTDNCGCADPKTTYAKLKNEADSPFLYYLENWVFKPGASGPIGTVTAHGTGGLVGYNDLSLSGPDTAAPATAGSRVEQPVSQTIKLPAPSYAADLGPQLFRRQVFCIPNNEKMFDYWDRVADRLFKLRHCMNIDGVKRSLALFQPPIDPALLVAARAAGLSLNDVLNSLYGELPAYRFSYLLEKAKAFAGTVQGFGGALLSALEKKDAEQLTLLRSTHEQNILKMTREIKKKAVEEAKANLQGTLEGMVNVVNRLLYYQSLIDEGLTSWEIKQQKAIHNASNYQIASGVLRLSGSVLHLLPQLGSPFSMKWGGKELGDSANSAAGYLDILASIQNAISSSASIEATFQRRTQDWKLQLKLAEQEIKQVQQQIISGQIRLAIAEKDLEIHEKQIEQTEEVHDFYKNKFTGLGLYNYMATTLSRLHRMAFNAAMDLARQAEAAYRFETGKDSYYDVSSGPYWDASRAGLLSGEQLSLALQKMDAGYLQWNTRQMEIRQSFSMRMLDPEQLLELRVKGKCKCTFKIPEWAFDMQYPGHYCRRIASVQITIPCVTGPYTNVAVSLALTKGSLRKEGNTNEYKNNPIAAGFPFQGSKMIATSSANNDGGQFELNFRDERYLPFEGAGAVDSEWVLELPGQFRSFDYDTISDVIFHLSYRSKYGDEVLFRTTVESGLTTKVGPLKRLVSLKEEFPDAWFQLESGAADTTIRLTKKHFPFFVQSGSGAFQIGNATPYGANGPMKNSIQPTVDGDFTITAAHKNGKGDDVWLLVEYFVNAS